MIVFNVKKWVRDFIFCAVALCVTVSVMALSISIAVKIVEAPYKPVAAVVSAINYDTESITFTDSHGAVWACEGVKEHMRLSEGQPVLLYFDDMGTADVIDDVITDIEY